MFAMIVENVLTSKISQSIVYTCSYMYMYVYCSFQPNMISLSHSLTDAVAPTVNHSVPQFVTVGKEETAYTVILSKPRPSVFPGLDVQLEMTNDLNQSAMVMPIPTTTDISFRDSLTYILVHTFHIPFSVNESTTLRLRFEEILNASSWSTTPVYTDSLVYTDIHIVSGEKCIHAYAHVHS